MARQKGVIKPEGEIGDISFYKTQDGWLAREKTGIGGDRIKNDPAFAPAMEQSFCVTTADGRMTSRLESLSVREWSGVSTQKRCTQRLIPSRSTFFYPSGFLAFLFNDIDELIIPAIPVNY